jgi:hypothetical protein
VGDRPQHNDLVQLTLWARVSSQVNPEDILACFDLPIPTTLSPTLPSWWWYRAEIRSLNNNNFFISGMSPWPPFNIDLVDWRRRARTRSTTPHRHSLLDDALLDDLRADTAISWTAVASTGTNIAHHAHFGYIVAAAPS